MSVGMIRIYRNQRNLCNQLHTLAQNIFRCNVFRIGIIGIQRQNTALQGVHDVAVGSFHHNVTDKTSFQIFQFKEDI